MAVKNSIESRTTPPAAEFSGLLCEQCHAADIPHKSQDSRGRGWKAPLSQLILLPFINARTPVYKR